VLNRVKPALDVGLYTNRIDDMRGFYEGEVGLAYNHLLKAGRGVHQHRVDIGTVGVLKLNDARDELAESPTGYVGLAVVSDGPPRSLRDPDGLRVDVVAALPSGARVRVTVASADPAAHRRWFVDGLGADVVGDGAYAIGETLVEVRPVPDQPETISMFGRGFRYLTIQVADVVAEHARLVEMGFREATPPVRLGEVAAISFVRDPGGNWLEISQRASLTGDLPSDL
jgi:lactoylglutathione lyase